MGCVRTNNEDNFAYDPANGLYVVCDGMGGMAAGEVASSIACNAVIDVFAAQPVETPALTRLSLAIHAANDAVRASSQENPEHHGMGTTLVAAVVEGSKLLVGNVGDSRAYLLQNAACMQLTVDHSYINELVRNGTVRVEDIHSVNLKGLESVITRAIGAAAVVDPDFFAVDLRENDTILLSSDGLTRYVDCNRIGALIDTADLDASCQRLIQAAKDAGGADNITCLLLRYNVSIAGGESVVEEPIHTSVEPPFQHSLPVDTPEAYVMDEQLPAVTPVADDALDAEPVLSAGIAEPLVEIPDPAVIKEPQQEASAEPEQVARATEEPLVAAPPVESTEAPTVEGEDQDIPSGPKPL